MNVKLLLVVICLLLSSLAIDAASHHKMAFVDQYDLDGDWLLYAEDFEYARKKRFNHTDENQDSIVNEEEYVFEYQNKLDTQLRKDRKGQVRQTNLRFNALDKNKNAMMEWQEYEASRLRSFTHYDVNKDGNIDAQDPEPANNLGSGDNANMLKQQLEKRRDQQLASAKKSTSMLSTHTRKGMFSMYDSNQDGTISKVEYQQRLRADFDLTDEDNNAWVSRDEYLFEYQNRIDKQVAKTRNAAIKQTYVRFGVLDKNKDGQMTIEEYQFSGHRSFNRWDSDKNNIVSMSELLPERNKVLERNKEPELNKEPEPSKKQISQTSSAQVVAVND